MVFGTYYQSTVLETSRHQTYNDLGQVTNSFCLGSPGRCIRITCDIHRPLWLVSVYGELMLLSAGTLR
jgi:hypothetical protein